MCGIVGYVGFKNATDVLIDGLRRLEYRGYDSAGVAVKTNGNLEVRKKAGKRLSISSRARSRTSAHDSPKGGTIPRRDKIKPTIACSGNPERFAALVHERILEKSGDLLGLDVVENEAVHDDLAVLQSDARSRPLLSVKNMLFYRLY